MYSYLATHSGSGFNKLIYSFARYMDDGGINIIMGGIEKPTSVGPNYFKNENKYLHSYVKTVLCLVFKTMCTSFYHAFVKGTTPSQPIALWSAP